MSVAMTSAGAVGWTTDRRGYRYEPAQPGGRPWPQIPAALLDLWRRVTDAPVPPDSCLVNLYRDGARMGLHQDRDEASPAPVVSFSLGDACTFRFGTPEHRGRPYTDVRLESGDLVVFGGPSRMAFHGVPKVFDSTAPSWCREVLGAEPGRVNITLRMTRPAA